MDRGSAAHVAMPSRVAEAYLRYRAELCRYVSRTFGSAVPDPQDIVQSVFAQYAALDDAAVVENPRAFLYRAAHNTAIQHLRRESARARLEHGLQADAEFLDDCDGESVLLLRERHRILEAAIRALDPRRQRVLVMNRIHGLSFAEISRRTGMSQTQVKRLAADAIAACNDALLRAFPDWKDGA